MIPYKTYVQEHPLFLALYGSTTIQSQLFLKNIKNFVWFPKQYLLGFFILEKQLTNILDRGFLFLRNTLLLYSLLLWRESLFNTVYTLLLYSLTDRMTDRGTNTLALRGLEEPFFQLCCCVVSVFGFGGKCGNLLYIIFRWILLGSSRK